MGHERARTDEPAPVGRFSGSTPGIGTDFKYRWHIFLDAPANVGDRDELASSTLSEYHEDNVGLAVQDRRHSGVTERRRKRFGRRGVPAEASEERQLWLCVDE